MRPNTVFKFKSLLYDSGLKWVMRIFLSEVGSVFSLDLEVEFSWRKNGKKKQQ